MHEQEKNLGLFHQANIHACFIRVLLALPLPAIQIPLLDGVNQSTLVYQNQGNLASALVVCVCMCVWGDGLATSKLLWLGCVDLTFHINRHKNHTLFVSFALKLIRSLCQLTQYTAS